MTLNEIFAKNLSILLEERGISGREAARICGTHQSHLANLLNGKIGASLTLVDKICSGFGLDPSAMMEED